MFTYLKTIELKSCDETPLRKVRHRICDLQKPRKVFESLAELKQPIQRGRLLILGNSDAGKTSTMKSLMGETLNPFEKKTCGVDIRLVDRNWEEIADSMKPCCAPTVEAKFVAEGAMRDRDEMQVSRRTTHEIYRSVLTCFFEKLKPYIGPSTCGKALTFYLFLLVFVAVLDLWRTAVVDAVVFLVLELHREVKAKAVDYRVWLFILYGFCIGIGIGKVLTQVLVVTATNLPFSFSDMMLALILICVAEFLMMSKRLIIGIPVRLRNLLDILDIPTDSAKIIHSCIIGIAFKLYFSGRCSPAFYSCIFLIIFSLRFGYLITVEFSNSLFARLVLLLEFILACYHFVGVTVGSVICFFVVDLFIHAAASCHNVRTILHREDQSLITFFRELMQPSHPLSKANQLLANPDQFQSEIEAIHKMRMQLLDFAGDQEYYCYHHIFLVDNAINLVVFDCSGGSELVHRQMKSIWFWLESIAIQTRQNNCVFLVATHCYGKSRDDLEKVNKLLHFNFYKTFSNKFVFNTVDGFVFFPVENKNGPRDLGICVLREAIIQVANEIFNENVHLPCFKIEDKISELRKTEEAAGLCITIDEFKTLAKNCGVEDTKTDHVLRYLCNQGLVLYTRENTNKLPVWILIQPQLLVDVIIKLVTHCAVQNQEPHLRRYWEALSNLGFLSKSLLYHILSPFGIRVEGMKSFLEDFNIICSVVHPPSLLVTDNQLGDLENINHFVPTMLPALSSENRALSHSHEKTFYIFFRRFLPEAAFYSLMAHAYKCSILCCPDDSPEMYKDHGLFWLAVRQSIQICYQLTLLKDEGVIKVTYDNSHPEHLAASGDMLVQVAEMMNTVCQTSFKHLEFHCGPACPSDTCPGDQPTSSSYLSYHCSQPRPHVFNVYPRCKCKMNNVSFNCRKRCFVEDLNEWLPAIL